MKFKSYTSDNKTNLNILIAVFKSYSDDINWINENSPCPRTLFLIDLIPDVIPFGNRLNKYYVIFISIDNFWKKMKWNLLSVSNRYDDIW